MMKIILSFGGGLLVGLIVLWGWNAYVHDVPRESVNEDEVALSDNTPVEGNDDITNAFIGTRSDEIGSRSDEMAQGEPVVHTQPAGETVLIERATFPHDGWIVVHELYDGVIANALGAARRDAGTYEMFSIPLLRATESNHEYAVVLYNDNGDREFDMQRDTPLMNDEGLFLFRTFTTE